LEFGNDTNGINNWASQVPSLGRPAVLNAFANMGTFHDIAGTLYREVLWLVPDQLGTPRMMAERTGSLAGIKRHDYLPFGEELYMNTGGRTTSQGFSGDDVRQKFTSKERDAETGLDYFGARYLAATSGRFTSSDPLLESGHSMLPQTWNRYTYAMNNPLRVIDPDGLDGDEVDDSQRKGQGKAPVRVVYVFVGKNDRHTQWKPNEESAKAGFKGVSVAGDNFGKLNGGTPGAQVRVINEGDKNYSPQGFTDALHDTNATAVVFVGDTYGHGDSNGDYHADGLDFGQNGKMAMSSPIEVNAQNVAVFACDSQNLKSMFNFSNASQSFIGMSSGSDGFSSPGWLGRAGYGAAETFEKGEGSEQALKNANDRFHGFHSKAPFGDKNEMMPVHVTNLESTDIGDKVVKP
ncbi:MAG TPA: RHS repeat-associated core domain-containing protein, partial [Nitrososphaera sp.]|nr:RHS repeat-associated core domain-containing protein [Nitrososphaera sp.]